MVLPFALAEALRAGGHGDPVWLHTETALAAADASLARDGLRSVSAAIGTGM